MLTIQTIQTNSSETKYYPVDDYLYSIRKSKSSQVKPYTKSNIWMFDSHGLLNAAKMIQNAMNCHIIAIL